MSGFYEFDARIELGFLYDTYIPQYTGYFLDKENPRELVDLG